MKTKMKILVVTILCMIIGLSVNAQSEKQDLTKNQVKVEVVYLILSLNWFPKD